MKITALLSDFVVIIIIGAIFENSVGLNVGMSDVGDASDSSDVGESGDYTIDTNNRGLVGLQNIGKLFLHFSHWATYS